jgi:hypothetical protein
MEKKKYTVVVEFTVPAVVHAVGEVIELTDAEAVGFGDNIKVVE